MNKIMSSILIVIVSIACSSFLYAEFRDPTRPPENIHEQVALSPNAFVLTEIVINVNKKFAVINGVNKQIGDEILGERITDINENKVRLEGSSGKITLFLFGKPIKRLLLDCISEDPISNFKSKHVECV